ncbi:MAG: VCBS repeat-containing protein [Planctomycetes bacterium]|nr:VCBS repeat-containing protein [Planctomycetota bacterium]
MSPASPLTLLAVAAVRLALAALAAPGAPGVPAALAALAALDALAALAALAAPQAPPPGPPSDPAFVEIDTGPASRVHWGRRGPDARLDLYVLGPDRVRIWEQSERGFPAAPTEEIALPGEASLVDFGDLTGDAGEEVVLLNRRGAFADERAWAAGAVTGAKPPGQAHPGAGDPALGPFRRLLAVAGVPVPLEHAPSSFARDLTGDGLPELVVPVRGGYELFARRGEGLEKLISLEGEHRIDVDAGGPDLLSPLRQEIQISQVKVKDLNGDGRLDILARQRDRTRCYLQRASGFDPKPTYELDLTRFQEAGDAGGKGAGKRGGRGGLGKNAIRVHEVDIDGDRAQDYIVAAGQHLRVYFASREGTDFSRPHTMLKLSSELQGVGSFDVDEDGRLDLVALKFQVPGLPRLVAAYFLSMSLELEILGYRNEGGRRFSRRPDWRNTLSLALPPLRSVFEDFDALADRFLDAVSRRGRFAPGDLDGDGSPDAVFLDDDGVLRVYRGRSRDDRPGEVKLAKLLFDAEKREWELQELLDFVAGAGLAAARRAVEGRKADLEVPAGTGFDPREARVEVADLDADGKGDVVLHRARGKLKVRLSR